MKKQRARGDGFFVETETLSYQPKGAVIGQMLEDSCIAAVCRMLLFDEKIDVPEVYLRIALRVDEQGGYVSAIPQGLKNFAPQMQYSFRTDLTLDELRVAAEKKNAIVKVKSKNFIGYHVVIVDGFQNDFVLVRDPLPLGIGSAYKIKLDVFVNAWLEKDSDCGVGIVLG
jgi:ABC-type bacteriocin/lantibiotic exporter with double-glycine peptidase domain